MEWYNLRMAKEKEEKGKPFFGTSGPFGTGSRFMSGLTLEDLAELIKRYGKSAKIKDIIDSEILRKNNQLN